MVSELIRLQQAYGGRLSDSASGDFIPSINPTRPGEVLAMVPEGSAEDVARAVEAASAAEVKWARTTGAARAEHLHKWAQAIQDNSAPLADAIVREVGKPVGEARGEVARCVAILRYYAGEAIRETGSVIPPLAPGVLQYSVRQPLGVVALITPWNFPLAIPLWKAAPALAVGNTVVLKPAEQAGWCAALLAQTARDAGLPEGVFNVVFGKGEIIGGPLLEHELVKAVSFTGSDKVGAIVAEHCARRNIKYQTEMGGKNVAIVLPDADMKQAANLVASGAMRFAGQKCTATSRVVVHRGARDEFLAQLRQSLDELPVGDPADDATAVGPVISSESQESLQKAIDSADAERFYGNGSVFDQGFFVAPTVFTGVSINSDIAQKELFGPVLAVIDANDLDHALELANSTRFGLSASLFTKDIASALKYVEQIEAGMVRVNADTTGVDPHAPFGGVKGSSSHTREQGAVAKDFYTEIKTVQINP
jgi:alpha-ketoglutaric semialdehyde dehydrogenase